MEDVLLVQPVLQDNTLDMANASMLILYVEILISSLVFADHAQITSAIYSTMLQELATK